MSPLFALALLVAADPEPTLPPARFSLQGERTLGAVVAAIERQTNIPLSCDPADRARPVNLAVTNVPFWDGLEQVAQAADRRPTWTGPSGTIAFSTERYRPVPMCVRGPFRIAVVRGASRIDFTTGRAVAELVLEVAWEPRFRAFHVELPGKSLAAGNGPKALDEGSGKLPVSGIAIEIPIRLENVPRSLAKLTKLAGEVRVTGTGQMLQFTFDAATAGDANAQSRAGVTAALTRFQKRGKIWTATMDLTYPPDGPEFESYQSYLLDNEIGLLKSDGEKVPLNGGSELGASNRGRSTATYRFVEKDGFAIANVAEWKVAYRTPGRIAEVPVRFEIADVPLP